MKHVYIIVCFIVFTTHQPRAQTIAADTAYIGHYNQKILLGGYVATNAVLLTAAGKNYYPNNPFNVGVIFALKNTVINAMFDYGVVSLKSKAYGKTKLTDFQIHNYGRKLMLDLFIQQYKGFYYSDLKGHEIVRYPDLSVSQIGGEVAYVFNGNKFSGKAAFEQSERQLKSAGSFILGGGVYLYKVGLDSNMAIAGNSPFRNFQVGLNGGYAYSWVINDRWLLSGMAKVGASGGNEPQLAGDKKIRIYPTAFARGSAVYQKANWAVSFLMLINNKSVYAYQNQIQVTSVNFQLAYVRHLDEIFRRKKRS
ncbi:DUF4421 family protein [Mucilaginibacter sp.]|uniref:DUF4421 family protein n=1 Tax=Mucilaginibacter sp. TaxID=1882438 RepID=UPI002ED576DC